MLKLGMKCNIGITLVDAPLIPNPKPGLGLCTIPVYTGDTGAVLRVRTPYRQWVVQQNIRLYLYGVSLVYGFKP